MIITKICAHNSDCRRCRVYFDNNYTICITKEAVFRFKLKTGMEMDGDLLEAVDSFDKENEARQKGLDLLSYRPHSKEELVKKLVQKGADENSAAMAADYLEERGYQNDLEYARLRAACLTKKGYSPAFILRELKGTGVNVDDALQAIDDQCPNSEETIRDFIKKRSRAGENSRRERERIIRALIGRGWSYDDFRHIICAALEGEELTQWE